MFLAPTVSSLRCNRAEREVSGWLVTRPVPLAGMGKEAVNSGVFAELNLVAGRAFGLVTNYGRRQLTDSVKVGNWNEDFSFRRLRRPIQTRRLHAAEPADQSSGAEASTLLSGAHRASGP
jgi:hypothetical protein